MPTNRPVTPPPEKVDARLAAVLAAREARTPAERDADVLASVTDSVRRGEQVPAAIMASARAMGWTPPDPRDLGPLVSGRIGGDGWTPDAQRAFLIHLAANGVVAHACRAVGLSRQSAHALRNRHPHSVFAILWDVAVRMGRRQLLDEAHDRALNGREEAIWHRGEQVGTRRVFSDRLLIQLLRHEPPPAHPHLSQRQMEELWSSLLPEVDAELPPGLSPGLIAKLGEDDAPNERS